VSTTFDPTLRPRAHFTPRRHWINDPNGLIWHDGEYHLFFQHNPEGIDWGNMSWGHAVSSDLASWTELPVALLHSEHEHVFSGCVVFDEDNTSGLGSTSNPPLVAVYTAFDPRDQIQRQALASSTDRGRTWVRYPGNPVLDIGSSEFRDPKVLRHDGAWVMAVVLADKRVVRLYRSVDLISWEPLSDIGPLGAVDGVWECPDLLLVPIERESGDSAAPAAIDGSVWVLLVSVASGHPAGGSGMQYVVGEFDGVTFEPTGKPRWLDAGADCYAAVSYADVPDGRPVIQGWMSNWTYAADVPAAQFRGSMTLPRQLALRRVGDELVLVQRPLVATAPEPAYELSGVSLTGRIEIPGRHPAARVTLEVDPGTTTSVVLEVRSGAEHRTAVMVGPETIALDRSRSGQGVGEAFLAKHEAMRESHGAVLLDVVVDLASVEVFADDGAVALTDLVLPGADDDRIALVAEGGTCVVRSLTVTPLREADSIARP